MLDKPLVCLHFVDQHLHQSLVLGKLAMNRLNVLLQAGDLRAILLPFKLVLHFHHSPPIIYIVWIVLFSRGEQCLLLGVRVTV